MQFEAQINRIKTKLAAHQLTQNHCLTPEPVPLAHLEKWESISLQTLPEAFRAFLIQIGVPSPCAFGKIEAGFNCRPADQSVCRLTPESTDVLIWRQLWETKLSAVDLFSGLFVFEAQGCSLFTAIVLNGPYRGRIVYIDEEGIPPYWCHEHNFLDWYERWLDEAQLGYQYGDCQFGLGPTGGEEELFGWIEDSQRVLSERSDALCALMKLPGLSNFDRLAGLAKSLPLEMGEDYVYVKAFFESKPSFGHEVRILDGCGLDCRCVGIAPR